MELTKELFDRAVAFAVRRKATRGDAQASSAEFSRSFIENGEIVLVNKPLSGWRFPEIQLAKVSCDEIQLPT